MSLLLVSPPSLQWANRVGIAGKGRCYLDSVLKSVGGIEGARFYPIEHLGLGSIKAYAAKEGLDITIVNAIAHRHSSIDETFDAINRVVKKRGEPILVGFSGPNSVFEENLLLARHCKARWPSTKCILGHDFATLNARKLLLEYPEFDFICRGDGEVVFTELSKQLLEGIEEYSKISGLAFRDGLRLQISPPSTLDVSKLPWPARDDLHLTTPYGFAAGVSSSRGCLYRCTFCTTGQTSALVNKELSYRLRPIEDVVDEIEFLHRSYRVNHITIGDDLFLTRAPLSVHRAEQFASLLIKRGIKIHFLFDCRIDSVDIPLFRLLYRSGLRAVFLGIETGDDEQRERYKKRVPKRINVKATIKELIGIGLRVIPGLIAFHPEVTVHELRKTLEVIDLVNAKRAFMFSSRLKLYPGTPLYDKLRADGYLEVEWPVPKYRFNEPNAERLLNELIIASSDPRNDYSAVRELFVEGLLKWEREHALVTGK